MFEFDRVGVYLSELHSQKRPFTRISSIGNEPISFLNNEFINDDFKKINVIVLVQDGNYVFMDDGILPHTIVTERDLKSVSGIKTNDEILKEAAKRAAFNAGTTIKYNTLSLFGKIEDDEIYYIYFGESGTILNTFVKTIPFSSLTKNAFLNKCTLEELRF